MSKRAKRAYKMTKLLPKYAGGGLIDIGRPRIPVVTQMDANLPWQKDTSGSYVGDEWQRSSTGSIIPDPVKPEPTAAQSVTQGLQDFFTPPKPKEPTNYGVHFADGGRIGLRGPRGDIQLLEPQADYSNPYRDSDVRGVPLSSLPQFPVSEDIGEKLPYRNASRPTETGVGDAYGLTAGLRSGPRDSSVPLRSDPVRPVQYGRPRMEQVTDITSLVPPRDPSVTAPQREFTNADITGPRAPSTEEKPVQLAAPTTTSAYPSTLPAVGPQPAGYGNEGRGKAPPPVGPQPAGYGNEGRGNTPVAPVGPQPAGYGNEGRGGSSDTKFIDSLPAVPTTPGLRTSDSIRDRGEPTGPLAASEASHGLRPDDARSGFPLAPMQHVRNAAYKYGIPQEIAEAQIYTESRGNPKATGPMTKRGASQGLAQILPSTGKEYGVKDPYDPAESADFYGRYMKDLVKMHGGDMDQAIAAYNTGPGNLAAAKKRAATKGTDWRDEIPQETKTYLSRIKKRAEVSKQRYANGGQIWGGPETDNYSTHIHAPIYKGPGGKWDGMPMFADGGSVGMAPARGHKVGRRHGMKALLADGGQINRKGLRGGIEDGLFYGDGGPTDDKVDIKASPGEFIIPDDSRRKIGTANLRRMVAATHTPVHLNQGLRGGYQEGDEVLSKFDKLQKTIAEARAAAGIQQPTGMGSVGSGFDQPIPTPEQIEAAPPSESIGQRTANVARSGLRQGRDLAGGVWNRIRHPFGGDASAGELAVREAAARAAHEAAAAQAAANPGGPPLTSERYIDPQTGQKTVTRDVPLRPQPIQGATGAAGPPQPPPATNIPPRMGPDLNFDASLERTPLRTPLPEEAAYREALSKGWVDPAGNLAQPRTLRGLAKTLRGASTVGKWLAPGIEAWQTGEAALDPNVSATMAAARGAEGIGRIAGMTAGGISGAAVGTALGGPFAPVTGPVGGLIGGTAGFVAPDVAEWAAKKMGMDSFLPSTIIGEEADKRAAARYKPSQTPEQAKAFIERAVKEAEAGKYPDLTAAHQRPFGAGPLPVAGEVDATGLRAPKGGGYISGIDPDTGKPRLISYNDKNPMPEPMGITDTSSPEVKAADKARRADWVAQSKAIDDKNALAAAAESRRLENMGQAGQLTQAAYDRAQGLRNRDPAAVMGALRTEEMVKEAQSRRTAADAVTAADARTRQMADAERYKADIGLRGDIYKGDAQVEATRQKLLAEAQQAQLALREKNMTDTDKYVADKLTQYTPDGKPDLVATAAMKQQYDQFVRTPEINNPKFLEQFKLPNGGKVNSINDIPREQIEPVLQRFMVARKQVADLPVDSSDTPLEGLPSDVNIRPLRGGDWVNWRSDPERNAIGFLKNMWGATGGVNPWVTPEQQTVLQTGTQGAKVHNTLLSESGYDTPTKQMALVEGLMRAGRVKEAQYLREMWFGKRDLRQ